MIVHHNRNRGQTIYLRIAYDANNGGGLTFAHGTPRAYHLDEVMVTKVEYNDRRELVSCTSQCLSRATIEMLTEKSASYSSPRGDGSVILCSDVPIDSGMLMDFVDRHNKNGVTPYLPNSSRREQTRKSPNYVADAPSSACQGECFHALEEADHRNWDLSQKLEQALHRNRELRQKLEFYEPLAADTQSKGEALSIPAVNVTYQTPLDGTEA